MIVFVTFLTIMSKSGTCAKPVGQPYPNHMDPESLEEIPHRETRVWNNRGRKRVSSWNNRDVKRWPDTELVTGLDIDSKIHPFRFSDAMDTPSFVWSNKNPPVKRGKPIIQNILHVFTFINVFII